MKTNLLEIPGGGLKIPQKTFVQRKMPGKKIRAAITSEKKNSCKQTAKLNALKKILQRHETEKKIRAAKILYPPPSRDF